MLERRVGSLNCGIDLSHAGRDDRDVSYDISDQRSREVGSAAPQTHLAGRSLMEVFGDSVALSRPSDPPAYERKVGPFPASLIRGGWCAAAAVILGVLLAPASAHAETTTASVPKSREYFHVTESAHGHYALLLHMGCTLARCPRPTRVEVDVSVGKPGQTTGSCPNGTFALWANVKNTRFAYSGKVFLAGHFIKLSMTGVFDSAIKITGSVTAPKACGGTDQYIATPGPMEVHEVPTSLTGAGVVINEQVLLAPFQTTTSPSTSYISEAEGLADARREDNNPDLTVGKPLLASLTVPGSVRPAGTKGLVDSHVNVPVWVITFTAPRPVNVSQAPGTEIFVRHSSIAINATSGQLVVGFFTR